jgi:hypothetical protein
MFLTKITLIKIENSMVHLLLKVPVFRKVFAKVMDTWFPQRAPDTTAEFCIFRILWRSCLLPCAVDIFLLPIFSIHQQFHHILVNVQKEKLIQHSNGGHSEQSLHTRTVILFEVPCESNILHKQNYSTSYRSCILLDSPTSLSSSHDFLLTWTL